MSAAKFSLVLLLACAGSAFSLTARATDLGPVTASLLTDLYQYTPDDCGDDSRPAYMCSGVMLRATNPTTAYHFYSISPASLANGGVSVSYLRKDAKFASFYAQRTSGFIFDNTAFDKGSNRKPLKVLCAYPIDGASLRRTDSGCGDYELTKAVETFCSQMGITTAEQWLELYQGESTYPQGAQCAFDMRDNNPRRAKEFLQNLRAEAFLPGLYTFNGSDSQENELVIAPWKVDPAYSPPVIAAFYVGQPGLAGARVSQVQWYQATESVLPAIDMTMPATQQDEVTFRYEAKDQAIYPVVGPDRCDRFIESAKWVRRYDSGFRKMLMSLQVVPTECGQRTPPDQTNNFFNEMVAGHYLDPEWINNTDNPQHNLASMRRQLICVMVLARNNPSSWFLEPSRPYTTHSKSLDAGCNNTVP